MLPPGLRAVEGEDASAVVAEGLVGLDQVARDRARHVADVEREATARPLGEAAPNHVVVDVRGAHAVAGDPPSVARRAALDHVAEDPGRGVVAEDAAADRIPPEVRPAAARQGEALQDRARPLAGLEPHAAPRAPRIDLGRGGARDAAQMDRLAAEVEHLQVGPRPHEDLIAIDRGHERLLDRGEVVGNQQDGGQEADGDAHGVDTERPCPSQSLRRLRESQPGPSHAESVPILGPLERTRLTRVRARRCLESVRTAPGRMSPSISSCV